MDLFQTLLMNAGDTSLAEIIAVITGLLSVWFARNENILVFPVGIVSVLIYVYLCFVNGLYADMGINAFYFVMSVYGWYNWARRNAQTHEHIPVSGLSLKAVVVYLFVTAGFTAGIYFLLISFTDSTVPFLDSFTTAIFITGMWLMARKKIENWLAWIVGDFLCIFLFAYKGLMLSSLQFLIFLILAVSGYIAWKKKMITSVV